MHPKTLDIITAEQAGTLPGLFRERVKRCPEAAAYRYYQSHKQRWHAESWRESAKAVARLQAALENESLYPGITWTDMVFTAKKYCEMLRPKVDVLVGLFHAGFDAGYSAEKTDTLNLPNENASGLVAAEVPGFDVIFAGHSHQERQLPARFPGGGGHRYRQGATRHELSQL